MNRNKRFAYIAIILSFLSCNLFAQPGNSTVKRYDNKLAISIDLLNAVKKRDIPQIRSIAQSLTLPYSTYMQQIIPTYKKTGSDNNGLTKFPANEIYPGSSYIRDSAQYNNYAAEFYYSKLIQSLLNDGDEDTMYGKNVYIVSGKKDNLINNSITSNYIGILFENKNNVKIINLEALTTVNNQLYSMRQANYNSYDKNKLPDYLLSKRPDDFEVYKLNGNNFTVYNGDTILFDNVNYKYTAALVKASETTHAMAEEKPKESVNTSVVVSENNITKDPQILDVAEVMPSFQGGAQALRKYIDAHAIRTKEASKKKAHGKVIVRFIIDTNGKILDPVVLKDNIGYGCADVALKAITKMPKWWPGKQNGKAVKVYYTLPFSF